MPVVNPVNTKGAAGKGLAKEFAKRYPDWEQAYKQAVEKKILAKGGDIHQSKNIISMATKEDWANPSKVEWVDRGLGNLLAHMKANNIQKVAIPRIGSGLGGLDFDKNVMPLIEKHFGKEANHHLVVLDDKMPKEIPAVAPNQRFAISITGTRDLAGKELPKEVKNFIRTHGNRIAQGGAIGTDQLAKAYAKEIGLPVVSIPVHWKGMSPYSTEDTQLLTPLLRNHNILNSGEVTLGVYSKLKGGTTHTLNQSFLQGKPTYFFDINKPELGIQKMTEHFERFNKAENETAGKIGSQILKKTGKLSEAEQNAFKLYHRSREVRSGMSGLGASEIEDIIDKTLKAL